MTHKIITKENGKFGIQRIASGCAYGNFDSFAEASFALAEMSIVDSSIGVGQ
jgi:hypothetical protein